MLPFRFRSNQADDEAASPRGASRQQIVVEQKTDQDDWWKPFWTLSSLMMFLLVLWGVANHLWQWLDRPVTAIALAGETRHMDLGQVESLIKANMAQTLLQVDIVNLQQLLNEQPWVRYSAIRRDWPEQLQVSFEEEVPVARWGERGLLNHQGDIFWPELKEEYRELPRLSGPAPETSRVMAQFHDLNQMFRPIGLQVVSLDLEARGAWQLKLNNGIKVVVGREAINERLQRFIELYQVRLMEQAEQIEKIDIRYTNGVAVKWRQQEVEEDAG